MTFLKKTLDKYNDVTVARNNTFWEWFGRHEKQFYQTLRADAEVNNDFLEKLMPELQKLNSGFYCLTGMCDSKTAELIITPEGDIKTIAFVEDLVAQAPLLEGWKFVALKPALSLLDIYIEMNGYIFSDNKIKFFEKPDHEYPDEINIVLVHKDFNESNKTIITNGTFIFLEHVLGEYNAAILPDTVTIGGRW